MKMLLARHGIKEYQLLWNILLRDNVSSGLISVFVQRMMKAYGPSKRR